MKDEIFKALIWVASKLFSARFLALVILVSTFSYINIKLIDVFNNYAISSKDLPPGVKEVFLIVIGAFIATINTVVAFYFLRNDRKTQ